MLQWQIRGKELLQTMENQKQSVVLQLKSLEFSALRKERLNILLRGLEVATQELNQMLNSLFAAKPNVSDSSDFLLGRLPGDQVVESYFVNVFRDWAWENGENEALLGLALDLWPAVELQKGDFVVVPGSGSSRLAWDLSQKFNFQNWIAFDINPLLMTIANRLCRGEKISLVEFPQVPQEPKNVAVFHPLEILKFQSLGNLKFLLGDLKSPPFSNSEVHLVLTPFVVDILNVPFDQTSKLVNGILRDEGYWLNLGPVGFQFPEESQNLTPPEIKEVLLSSGFEIVKEIWRKVPYLQSPYSSHGRVENLYGFLAKKKKHRPSKKRIANLPEWILDASLPVPPLRTIKEELRNAKLVTEVFGRIDGKSSIANISQQMGIPENQLQAYFATWGRF